jgi:deazaflavin-dependent oxidoreductase (nitroreductase family)
MSRVSTLTVLRRVHSRRGWASEEMIRMSTAMWPKRVVRDVVRQINKQIVNPVMLQFAGRRHFYASAIRHVGRRSGKQYVTPIVAEPTDSGFVVPLPYGVSTDWVRNVLAAGDATLRVHGETVDVTAAEVIAADRALSLLAPDRARYWQLMRTRMFLRLTRAPVATAVAPPQARPTAPTAPVQPDLRLGDPLIHDLVAEIDEAIEAGDEPRVDALSARLRQLTHNAGAGADT